MQLPNTKILIIIAGVILIILIAVTIFVSGLTKKSQISQQPTLIPTGIFESSSSPNKGSSSENLLPSEGNENTDNYKLMTDDEANKLKDLKNKTPLDTADFTIGYSSKLGEFFVSTKNSQGEAKFKQYLSANGLANVYNNFPDLFHINSQPLDQSISQAEQVYQDGKAVSDQQLQDRLSQQQNQQANQKQNANSANQEQTERDKRVLKSFSKFVGSLFTFSTGSATNLHDLITVLETTPSPTGGNEGNGGNTGGGGGGGGTIGGPISATAQELLNNPKLTLNQGCARPDLENGIVDERLITVLATILQTHTLYIGSFKTCHSKYIAGTNIISNHYYGRAADIMTVDGKGVSSANQGGLEIVKWLFALSPPLKPGEIGQPWFAGPSPYFTNSDHLYHIHVGYYAP